VPSVILPSPDGRVGSGINLGSRYKSLPAPVAPADSWRPAHHARGTMPRSLP